MTKINYKKNIMLIDDDEDFQELLPMYLASYGYEVLTASNGVDAIGILSDKKVDLILMEWMLPMLDGLSFLNWLREQERYKTLPLIILTARKKIQAETIKEAGADGIMYKPVNGLDILEKIKKLLQIE